MFVDQVEVYVKAGDGGDGAVAFRREKYVPRGGPSGGDGGRGGSVIAVADESVRTLMDFRYQKHIRAKNGMPGQTSNKSGADGDDLTIKVPVGTIIRDLTNPEIVADLSTAGQKVVVARGGSGGRGNARFATPVRRTPRFAEKGEPGQERRIGMELRLLADVGLIGYPNAGKSTLLSRISAARPKIADYPFTTLSPVLGVVQVGDDSFVAADIPGLIEGASQGVGLGHEFLRHIMRTRLLVHVVDVSEHSGRSPVDDWESIRNELRLYDPGLDSKPEIVVANKCDLPGSSSRAAALRDALQPKGTKVYMISAVTGDGIGELLYAISETLATLPPPAPLAEPEADVVEYVSRGPRLREVTISRDGQVYVVSGEGVENLLRRTDTNNEAAMARLSGMLEKAGIYQLLRDQGMEPGDTLRIADQEFVFGDEYTIGRG